MSIKIKRRTGEGQSQCIICASMGNYNVSWDNLFFSLVGFNLAYESHAICFECIAKLSKVFNESIEVVKE